MGIDPNTKQTAGQPRLGVLMLDTRFPRWPGDIGCDASCRLAPLREVVRGAVPREVVADAAQLAASGWAQRFAQAAQRLQAAGACAITTSCGFLVLLQAELQAAVRVPLVSSALLQLPALLAQAPQVGVLTIDAMRLGLAHLRAAGVADADLPRVVIEGLPPEGAFAAPILRDAPRRDRAAAEADLLQAALRLQQRAPALRHVVLECTNMPPHAAALAAATGWHLHGLADDPRLAPYFDAPERQA